LSHFLSVQLVRLVANKELVELVVRDLENAIDYSLRLVSTKNYKRTRILRF